MENFIFCAVVTAIQFVTADMQLKFSEASHYFYTLFGRI